MTEKLDKLGRRIPQFDRSAAGKKSAQTAKERHGTAKYKRNRAAAGSRSKRGYFGTLKDEGKIEELKEISKRRNPDSPRYFAQLKAEGKTEELQAIARKGNAKRISKTKGGKRPTIPGGQ